MTAMRIASWIAPRLRKGGLVDAKIRIAGRPVEQRLANYDGKNGVEVCGYVPDLRTWMQSITLYVMPMYAGAGVKTKLVEALAMGMPVVTNEIGAETLTGDFEDALVVVHSDKELVDKIVELLRDKPKLSKLRSTARSYAESNFQWSNSRRQFADLLRNVHRRRDAAANGAIGS